MQIGELTFDPLLLDADYQYTQASIDTSPPPVEALTDREAYRSLTQELEQLETLWGVWQNIADRDLHW